MAAKKKTTNGNLSAALKTHGWPPALPALLLTSQGEILESNARMDALLGPAREWPFFNEHDSKQALFKLVRQTDREELFPGEAGLKTYRIHVRPTGAGRRLVVAEMMRSGDLLEDQGGRQTLFRSLSHEIRTSVLALRGYLDMLDGAKPEVVERMKISVDRLDRVVERLGDFRVALDGKTEK